MTPAEMQAAAEAAVADFPPLTDEQIAKLVVLLRTPDELADTA